MRRRTRELTEAIIKIWSVPPGHKSEFTKEKAAPRKHRVGLSDLLSAGFLHAGMPLFARSKKSPEAVAILLPDGRIEAQGQTFLTPSEAAGMLTGHATNGWWYLLVQASPRKSLRDVWRNYVDGLAVDADEESDGEDDDDEA